MITLVEADKFAGEIAVIGGGSSVSKEVRDAFIEGGGVIAPEVTKETACLVFTPSIHGNARRNMGGRTRNWEKARKYGVKIVSPKQFAAHVAGERYTPTGDANYHAGFHAPVNVPVPLWRTGK